ncbi:MAG: hypothetical protein NZ805_15530 [Armatimonadetes bacterium]|nr:hypothetical protein [Armatimonadota bacterium]MDW8029887.1 hypothetical protein [Armatimonadota bacterium]
MEGDFHNFGGEQAHLILTPTVTVYTPDEPFQILEAELPSDEWFERVIQSFSPSQLPQGWIYFAPSSNLTLHFTIEDQRARLEKVVIKDWDGQTFGEILASADRKQISGSLTYDPTIELIVLEIWGLGSSPQPLATGVSQTPQGRDGFEFHTDFGFRPNPEDPTSKEGVLAQDRVPLARSYNLVHIFPDNDSKQAKFEPPPSPYREMRTKQLIDNTTDVKKHRLRF